MKNKIKFCLTKYTLKISALNAMISVKGGRLPLHLFNLTKVVVTVLNPSWIRLTLILLDRIRSVHKHQGIPGTVKFLKVAGILVQQSIAGYKTVDVTSIGPRISRTNAGLPRFLPSGVRKSIRRGEPIMIKWVLTMINLFRGLSYVTPPKLNTIVSPFSGKAALFGTTPSLIRSCLLLLTDKMNKRDEVFKDPLIFPICKSSANSVASLGEYSTHPKALVRTLCALSLNQRVTASLQVLINYYRSVGCDNPTLKLISKLLGLVGNVPDFSGFQKSKFYSNFAYCGKLGFKQEPAGKVRVFAMVDPVTQ